MPARPKSAEWREIAAELGDRVRELREARGWSQEELAHQAGIHRNHVQNIERSRNNAPTEGGVRGPANPTLDTIYLLADALQIEVAMLLPHRRREHARRR